MSKISTLFRLIKEDKKGLKWAIANFWGRSYLSRFQSDKNYLTGQYKRCVGKNINWKNPQTFNEKLQWLKLYNRKPEYTQMVDKYEAKKWIAERIGEEYIIPTLGVWDSFDEIDFDKLPNRFVLKTTHDSGGVVICKDKSTFDKKSAKKFLEKHLKQNLFWWGREWPYKNVKPRILAEEYMVDESGYELKDYKLLCFNGEMKCSFICSERFSKKGLHVTFFDKDWKVMPFERHYPSVKKGLPKPENYDTMVILAEKLSQGIPFIRVDFYEVKGKIYMGELTFFPGSGMEEFTPEEWDYTLGSWLELPKV